MTEKKGDVKGKIYYFLNLEKRSIQIYFQGYLVDSPPLTDTELILIDELCIPDKHLLSSDLVAKILSPKFIEVIEKALLNSNAILRRGIDALQERRANNTAH